MPTLPCLRSCYGTVITYSCHPSQAGLAPESGFGQPHLSPHAPPCLKPWLQLPGSRRKPQPGAGINRSLSFHLILQRMNGGLPLHCVKTLIDVNLIPNLFRGILIVILILGHCLRREKGHSWAGQAQVPMLALLASHFLSLRLIPPPQKTRYMWGNECRCPQGWGRSWSQPSGSCSIHSHLIFCRRRGPM